jgi:hypothetical protein
VVLANFLKIPTERGAPDHKSYGGLSGAFYPLPFAVDKVPSFAEVTPFGKLDSDANNYWGNPVQKPTSGFKTRGYIAHLKPDTCPEIAARLLGFTIVNFPRDTPHWNPSGGLASFEVKTVRPDASSASAAFI